MTTTDKRPFGFWTATALVVGGMIGAGIFVLPGQLAPYGWTAILGWVVATAGALVLAWVLSELFTARPEATGVVEICGAGLGPLAAVLFGWAYWVGVWSANAVLALTAVRYLAVFWPWLGQSTLASVAAAVALLWAITLLNLDGAKAAGRFQVATTALKLLPLVAVVLILAGLAASEPGRFAATQHAPFEPAKLTPVLGLVFFALVGFESAGVAAERVRDPERTIPRATMAGLALTGMLYILVSSGIAFALPEADLAASPAPVAMFVESFWGRAAGLAVAGFAMIASIGCLNGWVLVQGELPLGMARAGLLPAWVGRVSRRDVPVGALLVSSGCASVLILSNASASLASIMTFMLNLTSAATVWLYVGACGAALVLGVKRGFAAVGLVFALWVIVGSGLEAAALSVALMLTALPLYLLELRSAAKKPA